MLLSVYAHFVVLGLTISNSTSARLVWLPRDQWYRRYRIHKDSIKFWTITVTLTFKTAIQFFHKTLQLMMMYHQIKFGCQKISSLVDTEETVRFCYNYKPSLWPWPWRQHTDLLVWHRPMTPVMQHNIRYRYKVQQLRRYRPDEHSPEFWTFPVTLTLTTTKQSNLFTRQFSLWWGAIKPSSVTKRSAVQKI